MSQFSILLGKIEQFGNILQMNLLFLPNSSYIEAENKSEKIKKKKNWGLLMCALTFQITSAFAIVKVFHSGIKK